MAIDLTNIDLSGTGASSARKASAPQTTATRAADATSQQPESDVSITTTAALLARLRHALAAQPAADQSRIDTISKAISDGTYRISPASIARGLIQAERALGPLKER